MAPTTREQARLKKEIDELDELFREAFAERERMKKQFIDNLVNLIELSKYDDGALAVLIQWLRSGNPKRQTMYALVDRWAASMD